MENQNKCIACKHWNLQGTGYCSTVQLCWGYNAYEKKESEERKAAEEILKKYWVFSVDNVETQKQCIIEAMHEFASQSLPEITDREIEDEIWEEIDIPLSQIDIDNFTQNYKQYMRCVQWAKWYRDELKRRLK